MNQLNQWYLFDAKDEVLGRLATKITGLLLGKHRTDYADNKAAPVFVVIINTDLIKLTGRKEFDKLYRHYSGYPGGLKERNVAEQRKRDSTLIMEQAIFGMLPKNKLRDVRMRHVKIYHDEKHPHMAQLNPIQAIPA